MNLLRYEEIIKCATPNCICCYDQQQQSGAAAVTRLCQYKIKGVINVVVIAQKMHSARGWKQTSKS